MTTTARPAPGCPPDAPEPAPAPLAALDQLIARHAFARAAAAFSDAAAAARDQQPGRARKLAAEAADHLATADRAQNGLGFRAWPPRDGDRASAET
jgi:hypothetical protein